MVATAELAIPAPDNTPLTPLFPKIRKVPDYLTRRVLKARMQEEGSIPESLWSERARAVEVYVQDVIASQTGIVESVEINTAWDAEGPDLRVNFVKGFPIRSLGVEVKSSSLELKTYKQKIRDKLSFEEPSGQLVGLWTRELAISELLTENGIILINGGEKDRKEKTADEILKDSFYPQLERFLRKRMLDRKRERYSQPKDSNAEQPKQLFPESTRLFP